MFRQTAGEWAFEETLFSSAIAPYDGFGGGLAFDGRRIAAGAPGDDTALLDAGAVYIFEHDGEAWRETGQALPQEPHSRQFFAKVVALNGDTLVVGAYQWIVGEVSSGAAFVCREINGRWEFVQEIIPPDPRQGAWFGNALALEGEWLMSGAYVDDERGQAAGAVYAYRRQPDGTYELAKKLFAPGDPETPAFGAGIGLDGARMAVGASSVDGLTLGQGGVYLFELESTEWRHVATLQHDDPVKDDALGSSVALHGDTVVAGAPRQGPGISIGAAYAFQRQPDGSWRQATKFLPEADMFVYGRAIATDGATVVVGAPIVRAGTGAAHIFDLPCVLCRADLDGDGQLTFFDFLAFQALFAAGDPAAGFDGDSALTFFDFLAFQAEFTAGCA